MTSGESWTLVKAIFTEALTRPREARAAYIAEAHDDARTQREVESLLAAHEAAAGFLETSAPVVVVDDGTAPMIGRSVGGYTIEAHLGSGGMGEVYLARDEKLDRPVALKLLLPELTSDASRLERFHAEARAASSLNHPHILVVHDVGEIDGRPYIATEFVEGETVRQRLERGALGLAEAVEIALQVGAALSAAHARGLVHRDIKPENIIIRPDGYAKVLDFGLAKLTARADLDRTPVGLTLPGVLLGTPRYMSPEQVRGLDVDASSDVWSLGVLLYEMVAGVPPFMGATHADTLSAILGAEPVPILLQAPFVPAGVERVIGRALKKRRVDRYASIGEVIGELAAARRTMVGDETVSRGRVGPIPEAASPITPRHPITARVRLMVLPFRLLHGATDIAFLSVSLADAIASTLASLDSVIVRSTMTASRFAGDAPDLAALGATAQVDVVLLGTLLNAGDELRVSAQLVSVPEGTILWSDRISVPADNVIAVQDQLAEQIADALALPMTTGDQESLRRNAPATPRAYDLYLRGNSHFYTPDAWARARDLYIECVSEDPTFAPAWARLGRCYRLTAKFRSSTAADVRDNLRRASVSFQKAFDLRPDLPIAHHLYTPLETDLGRAEEAVLRLVRRARRRRVDAELFAGLVHACRYCGLLDASLAAHARAREIDPLIETSVALTLWMRGEAERAIDGFSGFFVGLPQATLGRDAEAIAAARASAESVRDPVTRSYRAVLPLLLEGRSDECRRLLDDLAPRNPDPESVFLIARTYARLGATAAAVEQFGRAVDMGFFATPWFGRDPWLAPLTDLSVFREAMARAERRHTEAARKFRDAGGERLLGLDRVG